MPEVKTLSQINILVAEHVMGWPHIDRNEPYRHHHDKGGVIVNGVAQRFPMVGRERGGIPENWSPASEIKAAWHVLETMNYPLVWKDVRWNCRCWDRDEVTVEVLGIESAPMAICLAALKAHGIDVSVKEEG